LRRLPACGFVSPHSHVQGSALQGFLPRAQPRRLVDGVGPSRRWRRDAAGLPRRHLTPPRPQGVAPHANPSSSRRLLTTATTRSPPGLCLLQVLRLDAVPTLSRRLPLDLGARWSGPRCAGLQRLSSSSPTSSREAADLLEVCACRDLAIAARPSALLPATQSSRQPFSDSDVCSACASPARSRKTCAMSDSRGLSLWARLWARL